MNLTPMMEQWLAQACSFGHSPVLWFIGSANNSPNDYDGRGMNHIGLLVQKQDEVDLVVGFLRERGISPLFDTPRHRPEFSYDANHTYYQVMFESPDRILFEVVYMSFPENNSEKGRGDEN